MFFVSMRVPLLLALAVPTLAFPTIPMDGLSARAIDTPTGCPFASATLKGKRQTPPKVTFNRAEQPVDVSGKHAFMAPQVGDQRGPCPGLNALANHGYLPRNGVTGLEQAVEACHTVYGMGLDLATFLSTYSTVMDGNPFTLEWSIGGPGESSLPPPLSTPQGLSGSHNKYEGDASVTRADSYINNGDSTSLILESFKELHDLVPDMPESDYDYSVLTNHQIAQRRKSESTNPYFFNGPFSGLLVAPAAYAFITRMMSNYSAEHPDGHLSPEVLKSFFAVSGMSGSLTHQKGHERIPDNWYKRTKPYGIVEVNCDLVFNGLKHPEFLSIGGNTGTVNSFAGIDVSNITGGVYNAQKLLEGNYLSCFAFQAAQQGRPDILKNSTDPLTAIQSLWDHKITPILKSLGCPELSRFDSTAFEKFPGSGGVGS